MNLILRALRDHRRQLVTLADEVFRLRRTLPWRARLLAGWDHTLRTVLAASVGYWAALGLGMEQGYWAAIVAISVSQGSYLDAQHSSRNEFAGAIVGGVVGLAASTLGHGHTHYLVYVLAVIVSMLVCWAGNLAAAGRVSAATSTIILLVPHSGSFWRFALLRLGEVALGAVAALLVAWTFDSLESRGFGRARQEHPHGYASKASQHHAEEHDADDAGLDAGPHE